MNSPSTHLAWHYTQDASPESHPPQQQQQQQQSQAPNMQQYNPVTSGPEMNAPVHNVHLPKHLRTNSSSSPAQPPLTSYPTNGTAVSNPDDMLLGVNSQYHPSPNPTVASSNTFGMPPPTSTGTPTDGGYTSGVSNGSGAFGNWNYGSLWNPNNAGMNPFGDMMIESQDVDTSMLGLDMMPWFDSYPHEYSGLFDPHGQAGAGDPGTGAQGTPQG